MRIELGDLRYRYVRRECSMTDTAYVIEACEPERPVIDVDHDGANVLVMVDSSFLPKGEVDAYVENITRLVDWVISAHRAP